MSSKKNTILDLQQKRENGLPITMLTAYDFPSALFVDAAGIDVILVGDSLGMVVLGLDSTVPVTMDEMLHHCKAVSRAAKSALLVGDMPFMSYQADPIQAVLNSGRFLKEAGMDSVKLEGGAQIAPTVKKIVNAGIPVMGHIGLTPQSQSMLGGYKIQGKTAKEAHRLLADAKALQDAGCYAIVLEAVPAVVGKVITQQIEIPTIGIGAGSECSGQVLVYHDLLGLYDKLLPRFVKKYADVRAVIQDALEQYRQEVISQSFPAAENTYSMDPEQEKLFLKDINN